MPNERTILIRSMLNELQDVSIEDEAVQRIVESTVTHEGTFKPLGKRSFFDTEPSQFDMTLSEQKKSR